MEAGHDAAIVAVDQDCGPLPTPSAPAAAAADAAAPAAPAVPDPVLSRSCGTKAGGGPSAADEDEWQMVTPGGSPRSNSGSAATGLTQEDEGPSDRQSDCSESGAQAELHNLALADSILAGAGAPAVPSPAEPPRARPIGGDPAPAPAVAIEAAAPAPAGAGGDEGCADAPATPSAGGRGARAGGAFDFEDALLLAAAAEAAGRSPRAPTAEPALALAPPAAAAAPPAAQTRGAPGAVAAADAAAGDAAPALAVGLPAAAAAAVAAPRGAGAALETQLAALSRWVLESVTLLARGARDGGGAVQEAVCAAVARLALMLPRTPGGKDGAGGGAGGVDWRTVLLGGGCAVSAVAAVFFFCRSWRLGDELHRRDRELAKLVVRIMSLQEVLSTYRRLPVTRYTHHTTSTTTHAAVTGFAHSMAYL